MKKRLFVLLLVLSLLLTGCAGSTVLDLSEVESDPDRFVWGSRSDIDVSLGDVGLFYPKSSTLRYYDLDAQEEYILCGRANCLHTGEDCSAYFPKGMSGDSVDYVAQVGAYIYCVYESATQENWADATIPKSIMLLRIDPGDGTRTVLASFPTGYNVVEDQDTFLATSINTVGYCGGWAWFRLGMQQPNRLEGGELSYPQITGVELETGRTVALNEYNGWDYSILCQCPRHIYYERTRYTEPMLTEEEFYAQADDTGTATINGVVMEDYSDYELWFWRNIPREYEIIAYSMASGEKTVLFQGETIAVGSSYDVPYNIYGEYQCKALVKEILPDEEGIYSNDHHMGFSLMDVETGDTEPLFEVQNGSALAIAQGSMGNLVFSDGKFFYAENMNDETAEIWLYDFSTGENTFLFLDDRAITFRIYGQWNGGYFGKHKDHQYQEGYYWISQEDFFAGNLDAMIHYAVQN